MTTRTKRANKNPYTHIKRTNITHLFANFFTNFFNMFSNFQQRIITGVLALLVIFLLYAYGNTNCLITSMLAIYIWILLYELPKLYDNYSPWYLALTFFYLAIPLLMFLALVLTPLYRQLLPPLCLLTFANDGAAYAVGKLWGKHKLFPAISPKKTIEGAIGGYFGTALVFYFLSNFSSHTLTITPNIVLTACFFSFAISSAAIVGDLFESYLKRSADVKDSGNLLPGHGGLLDRIDALLCVTVLFYMFRDQLILFFK